MNFWTVTVTLTEKVKVTVTVQKFIECLDDWLTRHKNTKSGWYLLNSLTFHGPECDEKRCFAIFIFTVFRTADPFATNLSLMLHHHKLECLSKDWSAVLSAQDHSDGPNSLNVSQSCIFYTTEILAAKLSVVINYYWCKQNGNIHSMLTVTITMT